MVSRRHFACYEDTPSGEAWLAGGLWRHSLCILQSLLPWPCVLFITVCLKISWNWNLVSAFGHDGGEIVYFWWWTWYAGHIKKSIINVLFLTLGGMVKLEGQTNFYPFPRKSIEVRMARLNCCQQPSGEDWRPRRRRSKMSDVSLGG